MKIDVLQTGPFGINTYVVTLCGNKALVFDPGACSFTGDASKITDYLSGYNLEPVAFILTHGHFDHITGTGVLKNCYPNVPLICHKADCGMIGINAAQAQAAELGGMGLEMLSAALQGLPEADVAFDGEPALDALVERFEEKNGGAEKDYSSALKVALSCWKAYSTPGHTPGSVCWYNKSEKVLISGDTIFYHSWGRTDFPGGSEALMMKSLRRMYTEIPDDVKVYPGHEYYGFPIGENK